MGWRRELSEQVVRFASIGAPSLPHPPPHPESILVLRNNDIGDLLVITPLFEALRRVYPSAQIDVGIGDWNRPVLAHNPWVSTAVSVNAPWHNKVITDQSPLAIGRYLYRNAEVDRLRASHYTIGIDVLGSQPGAWLLCRAGIPYRMGVRGYAGGHSVMQAAIDYRPEEHVGRSALRFAEHLGATDLPRVRPQLFLTEAERAEGERYWAAEPRRLRVVIAPGGGFDQKCWPLASFGRVVAAVAQQGLSDMAVIGGKQDTTAGHTLAAVGARDWTGHLSLRQTFAVIAQSDLVLTNASMAMHVAAAFEIPTVTVLGDYLPPADLHARQWGYDGDWCNLGKDATHPQIWNPDQVLQLLLPKLQRLGARV